MLPFRSSHWLNVTFVLLSFLLFTVVVSAADEHGVAYTSEMTHADSVQAWQTAVDNDNALDIASDVVNEIVYFPLRIVFTGLRESAGFINEYQVIPRIDDFLSSDDGRWRIVPIASNRTGSGAKFKFKPDPEGKTQAYLLGSWWLYGRQKYELGVKDLKNPQGGPVINANATYLIQPEERFYGFGTISRESDLLYFKHEYADFGLSAGGSFPDGLQLSVYGNYRVNNIHRASKRPSLDATMDRASQRLERLFNEQWAWLFGHVNIPLPEDISSRLDMGTVGARFEMNSVPNLAKPVDGTLLVLDASYHGEPTGKKYGYLEGYAKFGHFWHVYNERVLYADIEGTVTKTNEDGYRIPFYDYPTLGGHESLRGFQRDRYRGDHRVFGTVEYRFPLRDIWAESGLDFRVFSDWGQVFMEDNDEYNGNMQIGYGFGFATWNIEGSAISFDVGFSREGVMAYLSMGL
jgi:Omp85 superfamily domain